MNKAFETSSVSLCLCKKLNHWWYTPRYTILGELQQSWSDSSLHIMRPNNGTGYVERTGWKFLLLTFFLSESALRRSPFAIPNFPFTIGHFPLPRFPIFISFSLSFSHFPFSIRHSAFLTFNFSFSSSRSIFLSPFLVPWSLFPLLNSLSPVLSHGLVPCSLSLIRWSRFPRGASRRFTWWCRTEKCNTFPVFRGLIFILLFEERMNRQTDQNLLVWTVCYI